jgi:peroxiredoxin
VPQKQNSRAENSSTSNKIWLYANLGLALLLILAGTGMLLWVGKESASNNTPSRASQFAQHQGKVAPDFSLPALTGEKISLDDYAGQVVLINLWATWCPPCKAEMPTLNTFYETHKEQGFVVLAVNNQEDVTTVNSYIQEKGFSFPVLLDTQAEMIALYQVQGLPTTFIIDRNGQIQHIQVGEITEQQLESIVGPLL